MPTHTFSTPQPVTLAVENGSGRVVVDLVEASDGAAHLETVVDVRGQHADDVQVTHDGDVVSVVPPKRLGLAGGSRLDITVTAPAGSRPDVKVGSADVELTGAAGATAVRSGSGQVSLERVDEAALVETGSGDVRVRTADGDLRVKCGSGDVVVDRAEGPLTVSTGSGDVRVGETTAPVLAKTGSGDLHVDRTSGGVTLKTASGDLTVGTALRGRVQVSAASGDVRVGVASGTPVWTDVTTVSGRVRSELENLGAPAEGADHVEVAAGTVSGDVVLRHV